MKKLLLSSLAISLALATIQVQGQTTDKEGKSPDNSVQQGKKKKGQKLRKLEGDVVSELAKSHFYADFGDVSDVKWERRDVFDVATFTKDGQKITAYYDYDAELVGTVE